MASQRTRVQLPPPPHIPFPEDLGRISFTHKLLFYNEISFPSKPEDVQPNPEPLGGNYWGQLQSYAIAAPNGTYILSS